MKFEFGKFTAKKSLLAASVAVCAMAGAASAAPLSYMAEAGLTIPGWDRGPVDIGGQSVDPLNDPVIASFADTGDLTHFNSLFVDGPAELEFTFLISEANNENTANLFLSTGDASDDVEIFNNKNALNPNYFTTISKGGSGALDFAYCTDGAALGGPGCIDNLDGVPDGNPGLKIASSTIFKSNDGRDLVFFFFGDGAGDSDLTDLVVAVQAKAVPLPAGGLLLMGGLGGLAYMRRRKKANS